MEDLETKSAPYPPLLWLMQTHASTLWFALKLLVASLLTSLVGFIFHRTFISVVAVANSAATGASYLGAWAFMAYACKALQYIIAYVPEGSPMALANGYLSDILTSGSPTPPATPLLFEHNLDPRHITAIIGCLISFLGCLKGG